MSSPILIGRSRQTQTNTDTWPASLRAQFERTFGPRWGEAEDGRGRADLMALLGVKARGPEAERVFLEVLSEVGIRP